MEAFRNVHVQVISTESIKPNSPTPSHLKNLTHTLLDHHQFPVVTPTLFFYSAPVGATLIDITSLKTCLSQTLSYFYPLAGRYETWGTTLCNDQGVPFVEARVNCPLVPLLASLSSSSSDIDLLDLYPPKDNLIRSGIHVAIQINVFTCGGFALGLYHTHKLTDATSAATFLRHWAALVTERYDDAAHEIPDFNAGVIAFPPVPGEDRPVVVSPGSSMMSIVPEKHIVGRSFVFNNDAVARLKAASASEKVGNPSRFVTLAGFVWQQIMLASPPRNKEGKSVMNVVVDFRSRCDPVLPKGTMGNLIDLALARAEKRAPLSELVAEIHGSITKMKDKIVDFQGDKRAEVRENNRQNFVNALIEYEGYDVYILSAWCKSAGFSDVDFGFGKPDWIVPVDHKLHHHEKKDFVIFTDFTDCDGDGFEAWLFLEEQAAKFLESSPHFLHYATPRF